MLVPAYAATIHKSQGSEYPAVIIPVLTQHYAMLQRNLLYVARQEAGRTGRTEEGGRHRGAQRVGAGRSSASGCGQNRLSHDSSARRVKHVGSNFLGAGSGSMGFCRPGRCSPSTVRRPCSPTQRSAASRANGVDSRIGPADRHVRRRLSRFLVVSPGRFWRTKNGNLTVGQLVTNRRTVRARGRPGRQGQATAEAVQHAASDRPPETHRASGASARIATRRGKLT